MRTRVFPRGSVRLTAASPIQLPFEEGSARPRIRAPRIFIPEFVCPDHLDVPPSHALATPLISLL